MYSLVNCGLDVALNLANVRVHLLEHIETFIKPLFNNVQTYLISGGTSKNENEAILYKSLNIYLLSSSSPAIISSHLFSFCFWPACALSFRLFPFKLIKSLKNKISSSVKRLIKRNQQHHHHRQTLKRIIQRNNLQNKKILYGIRRRRQQMQPLMQPLMRPQMRRSKQQNQLISKRKQQHIRRRRRTQKKTFLKNEFNIINKCNK